MRSWIRSSVRSSGRHHWAAGGPRRRPRLLPFCLIRPDSAVRGGGYAATCSTESVWPWLGTGGTLLARPARGGDGPRDVLGDGAERLRQLPGDLPEPDTELHRAGVVHPDLRHRRAERAHDHPGVVEHRRRDRTDPADALGVRLAPAPRPDLHEV